MWLNLRCCNTYKGQIHGLICGQIYDVITHVKVKYALDLWLMNTYESEMCGQLCDVVNL